MTTDNAQLGPSSHTQSQARISLTKVKPAMSAVANFTLLPQRSHIKQDGKGPISSAPYGRVSCRQIHEPDLPVIIDLLISGFPERARGYWEHGLRRHGAATVPPGCPRYGYMLEKDGVVVGAILLLCHVIDVSGEAKTRCNMSTWYVKPDFRCYASLLILAAMKDKRATYLNISPAPHTWAAIEAQGFKCYCKGQFFSVPMLGKPAGSVCVQQITELSATSCALPPAEQAMLRCHSEYGCIGLLLTADDGMHPFIFLPFRLRVACFSLPCLHLVYCRSVLAFARFARPLGYFLWRYRTPFVAIDSDGPIPGLIGVYRQKSRKYFKGPDEPRHGDLAHTELVLFGP